MSAEDRLESENLELKLGLASGQAEKAALQSQLETMAKQVDRLSRTEADLNNELAAANNIIGENRAMIDDLTFRMGSADVEIKLYRDELQDLRNKLLECQKEANSHREQIEDMRISAQRENSINFRLSSSSFAEDDGADFGIGHDLIHDHDHKETETKIQTLEKAVEELHRSLRHVEGENGILRALLEKNKSSNTSPDVDSVLFARAEMSALLEAKEAEITQLRKIHEEALYSLRSTKDEEIFRVKKETENVIAQMQKNIDDVESEKAEIQQMYNAMCDKQEYLAQTIPSSFMKSSDSNEDGASAGIVHRAISDVISNETSLEKAVKAYVAEGRNDDVLQEMNNLVLKYEKQKLRNIKLLNKLQAARGNIQVCCRTRPSSSDESSAGGKVIVDGHDECDLSFYDWKIESWKPFGFDHVWPPQTTQADVFSDIEPLIASVAEGYNVCIFAYGQTGSGKTYTMEGYGTDYGIYYRSIQKLFELAHSKAYGTSVPSAGSPMPPSTPTLTPTPTPTGGRKPPLSHMPSSAHASASQRRLVPMSSASQLSPAATPTVPPPSAMERVFGAVHVDRGLKSGTNSELGSKSSSFRSENDASSDPLSDEVPAPSPVKRLVKQPSLFEFSNPISRRRSTLHVTNHAALETKKDPLSDEYHFLSERDDQPQPLVKVKIEMSMLEIYNEQVYDLLTDRWTSSGSNANGNGSGGNGGNNASMALDLRQGTDGHVLVHGLSTMEVKDMHEAMAVFAKGASNRATASTQLNAHSSRSHLIVQIDTVTEGADDCAGIHSKLFLVDLAGSERIEKSGATGSVLKEAQYINKSLLALGDVMEALDKKHSHVPYRNSKLTHLLQNALGGNARCMMIANVCPTDLTYDETMFTLQFATRVRNINLGIAHRHSNVKNLEEALKLTRTENRELKRKRQALEEALNIAKKEGTAGKLGDKFFEAKIKQLEETKRVGDSFIQQLQKQLHDANGKILEERRLREQAGVDAELLQRNLKKTTDQLKLEQEKSRRLTAAHAPTTTPSSSSSSSFVPTSVKSSIPPVRGLSSAIPPLATNNNNNNLNNNINNSINNSGSSSRGEGSSSTSTRPSALFPPSKAPRGGLTSGSSPAPTGFATTALSSTRTASTTATTQPPNASKLPIRTMTKSTVAAKIPTPTPTLTTTSISSSSIGAPSMSSPTSRVPSYPVASSSSSSESESESVSVSVSVSSHGQSHPVCAEVRGDTKAAESESAVPRVSAEKAASASATVDANDGTGVVEASSMSHSTSTEVKRWGASSASAYKSAFAAMMQRQQMQANAASPSSSSTSGPAADDVRNDDTISRIEQQASSSSSSSKFVKKSMSEQSMNESSDEEIFEVLIPDAIVDASPAPPTPTDSPTERDRKRAGMGDKRVSLDMILDELSVAELSVNGDDDDESVSLTVLSQGTGTSSLAPSHATSTLARRIARNHPGLYQPGLIGRDVVSTIHHPNHHKTSPRRPSPAQKTTTTPVRRGMTMTSTTAASTRRSSSPSSRTSPRVMMAPTPTMTPASSGGHRHHRPSPSSSSSSRLSVTPSISHSPVSRPSAPSSSSSSSMTTTRAGTVTRSAPTTPHGTTAGRSSSSSKQTTHTPSTTPPSSGGARSMNSNTNANTSTPKSRSSNTPTASASSSPASPTMKRLIQENNAPFQQHIPIPALQKTPPNISDRAKAALDIHKNRMANREAEKNEKTRSMKILDKSIARK